MMGLPNTTLKRGVKVRNGRLPIPHDKKKKKTPSIQIESQKLLQTFLILEGLFIMNVYILDKQSIKFTIWKYWKGCVKK